MSTKKQDSVHERLREARVAAGLSQAQVALKLSMHRPTVSEIEAGRRKVTAEEIEQFANVYGVGTDWIIRGSQGDEDTDARILIAARELSKMNAKDLDRLMRMLQMIRKSGN